MSNETIKVHLVPGRKSPDEVSSGIDVVVEHMWELLPQFGVEFVAEEEADITAVHIAPERSKRFDVIHCHGLYPTGSRELESWTWGANARVIDALVGAYGVTVPSPWVAELLQRDMGIRPDIVPHGINLKEWPQREEPPKRPVVLWNKNRPDDVCDPEPVIHLAGKHPDVPFASTFGEERDNLRITGTMSHEEMKNLLYRCGIYFSSTKETFGIGMLEAFAAGLPVLGWRWGHAPELIEHKVTGYLADPYDYEDTSAGLLYILENYHEMAAAARKAAEQYSWEKAAALYAETYRKALERKRRDEEGKISVVIPCYNYAQFVGEAIDSVQAQERVDLECIIVDDGSTDDSVEVIREKIAGDERFTLIEKENSGVAETRNLGAMHSTGAYICFLDADDMLMPDGLRRLQRGIEADRRLGLVYGKLAIISEDGKMVNPRGAWPDEYNVVKQFERRNQVPACCLLRREAFFRTGGFRQHTAPAEDAELWSRVPLCGFRVRKVTDRVIYKYRLHNQSATSNVRGNPKTEPDWLGWIPVARGGHIPFAATLPTGDAASHPVIEYDIPLVSIVTPVGDSHKDLLRDAIESVVGQTNPSWELIVVDDTTDGDLAKHGILPYEQAYPYIRWVRNEKVGNVSAARNAGSAISRGHYLLYLDADDMLLRTALDDLLEVAINCKNDTAVVYPDWICYPEGKPHMAENWSLDRLMDHALFAITFLHPKEAWETVGGFDEEIEWWEDWDYTIRLALAGYKGIRRPKPLFIYRYDTGFRREESLNRRHEVMKQIRGKYAAATPKRRTGG